jgi:Transglutaminase-like superfamily/TgpA N-terminal domain
MSTPTSYVDRLEQELLRAIRRRRRKRTLISRLGVLTAAAGAVSGLLLVTGDGASPVAATDIRGQLSERSEVVAFVVSSPVPAYWRLTALTDFDGTTWSPPGEIRDDSGPTSTGLEPAVDEDTVSQTFQIVDLDGIWLPAASSPVRVDGSGAIAVDAETSSLVTTSETLNGLVYTVESVLPRYDVARLRAADTPPTGPGPERHLALPADFPAELAEQAREITARAPTPYDRAIALQNWFRTFDYDLSSRGGSGYRAMQQFLAERRGYCVQFAGTFAAFARVIGLPSRVAVGFTPGQLGEDGRYYVQGRHAHTWPEIYFEGVGWVPFEPTPSRGNPIAAPYTGIPADQDGE